MWPVLGPRLCAYACVYANPTLQHKHKHAKNELVCFFFCAYAYITTVFTCLHMCLCLCLCAVENFEGKKRRDTSNLYVRKVGPLTLFSNMINDYGEQTETKKYIHLFENCDERDRNDVSKCNFSQRESINWHIYSACELTHIYTTLSAKFDTTRETNKQKNRE